MKKIILSLFLLLGVVTFSAPSYVDVKAIKDGGYQIGQDTSNVLEFTGRTPDSSVTMAYFYDTGDDPEFPRQLNDKFKTAPTGMSYKDTVETSKFYVNEFTQKGEISYYTFVTKKSRKNRAIVVILLTLKGYNIPSNNLETMSSTLLNEAESYLR